MIVKSIYLQMFVFYVRIVEIELYVIKTPIAHRRSMIVYIKDIF